MHELPIDYENLITGLSNTKVVKYKELDISSDYINRVPLEINQRIEFINKCILKTLDGSESSVKQAVNYFCEWMVQGAVVRLIGAGRAKLAGAIPTDNIDAKIREMEEEAKVTLGPIQIDQFCPGMISCWLSDPKGNIIELAQGYFEL